jgi:hypothetical protein
MRPRKRRPWNIVLAMCCFIVKSENIILEVGAVGIITCSHIPVFVNVFYSEDSKRQWPLNNRQNTSAFPEIMLDAKARSMSGDDE